MSYPNIQPDTTDSSDISLDEAKAQLIIELSKGETSVLEKGWLSQDEVEKELESI